MFCNKIDSYGEETPDYVGNKRERCGWINTSHQCLVWIQPQFLWSLGIDTLGVTEGKQSTGMGKIRWQVWLCVIPCITWFVVLMPSIPWHGLAGGWARFARQNSAAAPVYILVSVAKNWSVANKRRLAELRRQPPYYSEREENTCRFSLGQDTRMYRGQEGGGKHVWSSSREHSINTECSRQYPSVTFLLNPPNRFISSSEISYQLHQR